MTTYSPLMLLRRHPQASTVRPRLLPGLSLTAVTYSPLAEPQAFRSISTKIRPTSRRAEQTRHRLAHNNPSKFVAQIQRCSGNHADSNLLSVEVRIEQFSQTITSSGNAEKIEPSSQTQASRASRVQYSTGIVSLRCRLQAFQ
jgi:hypothetical protein